MLLVELRNIDRARNRFRIYRMWQQPTLFGGLDASGRACAGAPMDFTPARWNELLARRRRNGYQPHEPR